jgi:hypothetical protein
MEWYTQDSPGSRKGQVESSCVHGKEPAVCIKFEETLESLCKLQLLKKGSNTILQEQKIK